SNGQIEPLKLVPGKAQRRRHQRKYAAGDLQDQAFVFRGPKGKLRLRARNLSLFLQMAEGVDEETWLHHLRQGDYSRWFREVIMNCAWGNFAPSIPMKGMVPPSPIAIDGLPKQPREARSTACASQGASGGASQPAADVSPVKVTRAP